MAGIALESSGVRWNRLELANHGAPERLIRRAIRRCVDRMSPAPHSRPTEEFAAPSTVEIWFESRNGAKAVFSRFSTNSKPAVGDTEPSAEPKASILAALLLRFEESGHRRFQVESRSLYDAVRRPRGWLCDWLHLPKILDETTRRDAVKHLLETTEAQPKDWADGCLEEKSTTEPPSGGNGWVILTKK